MWRPPRPTSTAARDLDQDAHRPEGDLDQSCIGSMRHRVVPPTGVDGWKAQGLFIGEQVTDEEVCTDGTQSGYFTDLLVNDVDESQFAAPTSGPISNGAPTAAKSSQVDYLMEKKKEADVVRELKKEEMCKKAFALQEERSKRAFALQEERNKLEREKFEFQKKEAEKAEKVEE
uniref:Uncharacterized protein n=1 Tax=Oryza meridionalis TaxID=40149 RepID=A0A0E0F1R6_9ORYZ